ncbi:membrane-anchored ubiquitin-fold protein 4 [Lolium rigidum]|uniref:membrane-anchored ubiquitin-fold protein 4 n=1 Tax=Lolium rigidum TaxID=89674 RepID=UPI001F5D19B5|nr:membrane-anchored ubiquitin-fold protein 4 [Lolium rigidum]
MAEAEEAKVEGTNEEQRAGAEAEEEEEVDVKFRLFDGSDIGPVRCNAATTTVAALKDRVVADWPKDKSIVPKTANDVKLISGGKILENDKNIAQCRAPFGDLPSTAITMHVVVQPSSAKSKPDKKANKLPKTTRCSCTIL